MSAETLKCVVVGDGAVGKTCLLIRYAKDEFPSGYVPTIFDSYAVTLPIGDETFQLHLFDTAGQEDYDQLRRLAFSDTDVLIVCFSVDFHTSYTNVRDMWIPELRKYCPGVPYVLVGTKIDLRDSGKTVISKEQGEKLARELQAVKYVECSALTKQNVNEVFKDAIIVALSDGNPRVRSVEDDIPSMSHTRAIPFNPKPEAASTSHNTTAASQRNDNDDCLCKCIIA